MPTSNRKIFDNLVAIRSHDPLTFDNAHPFAGRLISDKHYLEEMQERLEKHPSWFKLNHPGGWRVVDGGYFETPLPGPIPPIAFETVKEDCRPHAVPEPRTSQLLNTAILLLVLVFLVRCVFGSPKS